MSAPTCSLPHKGLLECFQAMTEQGWSPPASSGWSSPRPNLPTPDDNTTMKGKALHKAQPPSWKSIDKSLQSCHCDDGARAHEADEFSEEGLTPQVPVVLPEELLRGLRTQRRQGGFKYLKHDIVIERFNCSSMLNKKGPSTCMSLRPTSLKPFFSKRRTIAPTCFRWTPSGFTATKVRSFTPVQPTNSHGRNRNEKKGEPSTD